MLVGVGVKAHIEDIEAHMVAEARIVDIVEALGLVDNNLAEDSIEVRQPRLAVLLAATLGNDQFHY